MKMVKLPPSEHFDVLDYIRTFSCVANAVIKRKTKNISEIGRARPAVMLARFPSASLVVLLQKRSLMQL